MPPISYSSERKEQRCSSGSLSLGKGAAQLMQFVGIPDAVNKYNLRQSEEDNIVSEELSQGISSTSDSQAPKEWFDESDDGSDSASRSSSGTAVSSILRHGGSLVRRLRQAVIVLFVYLSVCAPIVVYVTSRKAELDSFESDFEALSTKLEATFQLKLARLLSALDSLSIASTSYALDTNSTFPFVTLLDFDLVGSSIAHLAKSSFVATYALVSERQRSEWENYTIENAWWLWQAMERTAAEEQNIKSEPQQRHLQEFYGSQQELQELQQQQQRQQQRPIQQHGTKVPVTTRQIQQENDANEEGYILQVPADFSSGFSSNIYRLGLNDSKIVDNSSGPYIPTWQHYPPQPSIINYNLISQSFARYAINVMVNTNEAVISDLTIENVNRDDFYTRLWQQDDLSTNNWTNSTSTATNVAFHRDPTATAYYPIFDSFNADSRKVVGIVGTTFYWRIILNGILPRSSNGIVCVIDNACGGTFSWEVNGMGVTLMGSGDLHDADFNYLELEFDISIINDRSSVPLSSTTAMLNEKYCPYSIRVYPSVQLQEFHISNRSMFYAIYVFIAFMVIGLLSRIYDCVVQRRMRRILKAAHENRAIVSSIFPENVRRRLFHENSRLSIQQSDAGGEQPESIAHPKVRLKTFLASKPGSSPIAEEADAANEEMMILQAKPIADLFPYCTVLFADISGFSAWSSEREPEQVFTLLETIFRAFDKLARKRNVFKVETIGDTYVAVTGLPDSQPDHAIRMTRYARDCLIKVNGLTKSLEKTLGPDTGELRLRFGLHSGQVTAGVLRGQKSRFQLFGDTVNTASRMESTGQRNRIQLSNSTAQLLIEAGKERWIQPREDAVNAKGKGVIQTYWLLVHSIQSKDNMSVGSNISSQMSMGSSFEEFHGQDLSSVQDDDISSNASGVEGEDHTWGIDKGVFALPPSSRKAKNSRLVVWLTDLMSANLKPLIAQRSAKIAGQRLQNPNQHIQRGEMILDELVEAFTMPRFDLNASKNRITQIESVELSEVVIEQLRDYVTKIAERYLVNPFHNFEHASHVTMSSIKLLKRIVIPEDVNYRRDSMNAIASDIHRYTFGINSDALAQFAVVFSALIHDVDHTGVPNGQLAKEKPELGARYKHQSVAEQNSVDIAWDLLMDPSYKDLQACIFTTQKELKRFRQYVVNLVIATDIFNKELKAFRNERWDKAFSMMEGEDENNEASSLKSSITEGTNLKATIVLEHIIQASDVSHTMQHWNVYKKWNERLFQEMYAAFDNGRSDTDPCEGWYKGELWFFDNYIIPLAQKLEECGVFGVSSDEYLNYALENRKEWALKGRLLVEEMKERYNKRKMLEIGGFTRDEIEDFSAHDLEFLIKRLIRKGRSFGSFEGRMADENKRNAARAWFDAFEIFERCPASSQLKDRGIIFPVYSEFIAYLKGGMIFQDREHNFEINLANRFFRDAMHVGNHIHIMRALAVKCDVLSRLGRFDEAFASVVELRKRYDAKVHSAAICKHYRTDLPAKIFALEAVWHYHIGEYKECQKSCDHVLQKILPFMDPENLLNIFELLFPIVRIQKHLGMAKPMRDLLYTLVVQPFEKQVNTGKSTSLRSRPIFQPLLLLLDMCNDPESAFEEARDWLEDEESTCVMDDFLDNFYGRLCWAPSTILAELCLLVAQTMLCMQQRSERAYSVIQNGLEASERAELILTGTETGEVLLPIAYKVHDPVRRGLMKLGEEANVPVAEVQQATRAEELGKRESRKEQALETTLGVVRLQT